MIATEVSYHSKQNIRNEEKVASRFYLKIYIYKLTRMIVGIMSQVLADTIIMSIPLVLALMYSTHRITSNRIFSQSVFMKICLEK